MRATGAAWRTTPFRLALGFGGAYVLGVALLLGLVYLETATSLSRRTDRILAAETALLSHAGPEQILGRLDQEARRDPLNDYALYAESGQHVAGASPLSPADLPLNQGVREFARTGRRMSVRALATRLPWGETVVVSRDTGQLLALRHILLGALVWSGSAIAVLGVATGFALGLEPLRRIGAMRLASQRIMAGELGARLPVSGRRDELDELAAMVNTMMDEVERLMVQARTAGESVAHELRTPLTRLRATLEHASEGLNQDAGRKQLLELCTAEVEGVLARFRALLRIAAVEAKSRRSQIAPLDLSALLDQLAELYKPLAEERGLTFRTRIDREVHGRADGDLFFEAIANLVDNAIKFTPPGGEVELRLISDARLLEVSDTGPGVAAEDLPLLTRRFYRSPRHSAAPGHGLGLSLVAAVMALHGFSLSFDSAEGGTTVTVRLG